LHDRHHDDENRGPEAEHDLHFAQEMKEARVPGMAMSKMLEKPCRECVRDREPEYDGSNCVDVRHSVKLPGGAS
jgi:hypothetical protein